MKKCLHVIYYYFFLGDDKHQEVVLKILYHLSYEDEVKHNFVDCIGLVSLFFCV